MERIFQIIAAVLAGIAAFFLYKGNKDAAFITIVFGCVSFFFSIRAASKLRVEKENSEIIAKKYGDDADATAFAEGETLETMLNMPEDAKHADKAK